MGADVAKAPLDGDDDGRPPDWPVHPGGRPTGLSLAGGMGMLVRLLLGVLVSGLAGLAGGLIYGARVARQAAAKLPPPRAADDFEVLGTWFGALLVHGALGLVAGAALGVIVMLAWTIAGGGLGRRPSGARAR
jgi:hypothetical protein